MSNNFSTAYSAYYDLLNAGKPYRDEATFSLGKVASYIGLPNQILELGLGTGEHARYWCEQGYKVTGVERSEDMCKAARAKRINGLQVVEHDITRFDLTSSFDAAFSMFHVMSYLCTNMEISSCLERVNRHLKKGGVFFFDAWYSPAVLWQRPKSRERVWENDILKVVRQSNSKVVDHEDVIEVHFSIKVMDKKENKTTSFEEDHPMRHFSIPFMQLMATSYGFRLVETFEMLTNSKPSLDTWSVCFLLKKERELSA